MRAQWFCATVVPCVTGNWEVTAAKYMAKIHACSEAHRLEIPTMFAVATLVPHKQHGHKVVPIGG